jgi:hypothetical protein
VPGAAEIGPRRPGALGMQGLLLGARSPYAPDVRFHAEAFGNA